MSRTIFRQAALDRLAAPEALDRPVRIVGSLGWLGLLAFAVAVAGAVAWAAVAQAPVKIAGQGIIIQQGGLLEITASNEGRIGELRLAPGQSVSAGDTVALLVQSDLSRRLAIAEANLAAARSRHETLVAFYAESRSRELAADQERLDTIAQTETLLGQRLRLLEEKQRGVKKLVDKRTMVRDRLIDVQVQVSDTRERLANLDDETAVIKLRRLERESQRKVELLDQRLKVEEYVREADRLSRLLADRRSVESPAAGRVVEVKVNAGDVIRPGTALATLAPAESGAAPRLQALLYIPPADGKQVRPGMTVEIAPTTVRREEFGTMRGRVVAIAPLPATLEGMRRTLQNDRLVKQLSSAGPPFEATIELERDAATRSGFKWSSSRGPDIEINAGTLFEGRVVVRHVRIASLAVPRLQRLLDGDVF